MLSSAPPRPSQGLNRRPLVPSAGQAKRVALIIGMSDYQHLSSLINPVLDAKAIAAELKSHGFEVSEYYNLDRAEASIRPGS